MMIEPVKIGSARDNSSVGVCKRCGGTDRLRDGRCRPCKNAYEVARKWKNIDRERLRAAEHQRNFTAKNRELVRARSRTFANKKYKDGGRERRKERAKRTEHAALIYYVTSASCEFVKIGTTTNLTVRLMSLQTGSPVPLIVLGTHPGDRQTENGLHSRFKHLRAHGEWFHVKADLAKHLIDLHAAHLGLAA